MDYDFWLRIGERFPVVHVDAVWATQRLHDDAKSMRHYDDFWPERLAVSRRHGGRLLSPLLISRYVRSPNVRRVAVRAAAAEFIEESHRKFIRRSALPIPSPAQAAGRANGHSGNSAIPSDVTVLLLDSIGELASVYRLADGAFVGGSLVPSGGHNILEPAAFGKVPVFGPSMENFAEIASRFVAAGAAIQVESPEDVGVAWIALLRNPQRMKEMSDKARSLVEGSRGATGRALEKIAMHLNGAGR